MKNTSHNLWMENKTIKPIDEIKKMSQSDRDKYKESLWSEWLYNQINVTNTDERKARQELLSNTIEEIIEYNKTAKK